MPKTSQCIFVLRNHDKTRTLERLLAGLKLMQDGYAPVLLIAHEGNTREEANRLHDLVDKCNWSSVILVTHWEHGDRAYLTFLKALPYRTKIYIDRVEPEEWSGPKLIEESIRIDEYQLKGDVASYAEGVEYLQWLQSLNPPLPSLD